MLDIDGFRMDKGVQTTLDAMADFSTYQRECARRLGKENFLMVGEVVGSPDLAATYFGRGKTPDQAHDNAASALATTNVTDPDDYIRSWGHTALDGAAFQYDVYGSMTRFLGLDGAWGTLGVDWVKMWHQFLLRHDFVNANNGAFDPRHIFGITNQDVFRWPALANGTQRQLLGLFVITLELPGIPMILYGEEQAFYVLENSASNYVYGRTPMASQRAWQLHGCYNLGEQTYVDMPFDSSSHGCEDDTVSLDHRDSSHPMYNILKRMFDLREQYPILNDGYNLTTLSTRIYDIFLPGSVGTPSPHGVWSVFRGRDVRTQDFTGIGHGNQAVWLLFHNENHTVNYEFDCSNPNSTSLDGSMIAAFDSGTTVKNLFYPYDEYKLEASAFTLSLENNTELNGCIPRITLHPWEFKAFVPLSDWNAPKPVITGVVPSHDARLQSTVGYNETESIQLEIYFSEEMDCASISKNLRIESSCESGAIASLDNSTVVCRSITPEDTFLVGQVATVFTFSAALTNVGNGVHTYTIDNATSVSGDTWTNSRDKFMIRIGADDNPIIFPETSNFTKGLLQRDEVSKDLFIIPRASGADLFRYSTNWGSSYSDWQKYEGGRVKIEKQAWYGTKDQAWEGEHIIVNYWSKATGSSDHIQHSDLARDDKPVRRWPHAFIEGVFNQWGFDSGVENRMRQDDDGMWTYDLFTEWPTNITLNVWGMNPDGQPDKSAAYGDLDRDGILDWAWPNSLLSNFVNISAIPSGRNIGYRMMVDDGTFRYSLVPHGSSAIQLVVLLLLVVGPIALAIIGVQVFIGAFYKIKFNKVGLETKMTLASWGSSRLAFLGTSRRFKRHAYEKGSTSEPLELHESDGGSDILNANDAFAVAAGSPNRRTVLIATAEYEIEAYNVKIKIGGLGVMASLMGKSLTHQNLIWVVPCVGGVEYPFEEGSETDPILINIMGQPHYIETYVHIAKNITYVLLDSPIFRKCTKAEPYPQKMDDLPSGLYYSAWNQCIAEMMRRYKPDLYHINDYHGACAPLYLLPEVIPCCLSLHNAEFQGKWPLRTKEQMGEMSRIFDLSEGIIKKYIQFGEVFNLLHAGASYLRIHQDGFGAVGVSKKYGKRSLARYPILWGLQHVGALPNPDPSDTAPLDKDVQIAHASIDPTRERERGNLRKQAQEWAGLNVDPDAELFIFVGRWSVQKGIDLVADVFPWVLEKHPNSQLICVGPVIDLYGRFAALRLAKLMEEFPGRVFSKPEFTALPPYLFGGAEFALMPSRDEPFGLVAVEFGRKGALCVGARVGGFGHMPGWWFTVESVTSKHLLSQFKSAITTALASDRETRAMMRAYALLQRFPVAQWVKDLDILQSKSVEYSERNRVAKKFQSKSIDRSNDNRKTLRLANKWRSSANYSNFTSFADDPTIPALVDDSATLPPNVLSPIGTPSLTPVTSAADLRALAGNVSPAPSSAQSGTLSPIPEPYVAHPAELSDTSPEKKKVSFLLKTRSRVNLLRDSLTHSAARGRTAIERASTLTPTFDDSTNRYSDLYSHKLDDNSKTKNLSIEDYIVNSEKQWFNDFHTASLRSSRNTSRTTSRNTSRAPTPIHQSGNFAIERPDDPIDSYLDDTNEYDALFGEDYLAPTGCRKLLQRKVGTWYLYCFLLAIGQVMSASSYQLTLLTGAVGEPPAKLYVLCSVYVVSSIFWWTLYRTTKAIYCLSIPFCFFGACFLLLGVSMGVSSSTGRKWVFDVAATLYAIGSAAGALFFSLNFGTEGGTPSQMWAFRACVLGGSQNLLIAFLWYWGSFLTRSTATGILDYTPSSVTLTAVCIPLAVLMFAMGVVLYLGLPDYYRQDPGAVASFYRSMIRREIVIWFWLMVILQNYWLSSPYNRNWLFLWSSQHAPRWAVALLVILFFGFVWAAMLTSLAYQSKQHSWIIPVFAIGLGAPRWCQMLWSLSGIGFHVPWGGLVGGALISRSVWLWLGVLDALQGVGFSTLR